MLTTKGDAGIDHPTFPERERELPLDREGVLGANGGREGGGFGFEGSGSADRGQPICDQWRQGLRLSLSLGLRLGLGMRENSPSGTLWEGGSPGGGSVGGFFGGGGPVVVEEEQSRRRRGFGSHWRQTLCASDEAIWSSSEHGVERKCGIGIRICQIRRGGVQRAIAAFHQLLALRTTSG